MAWSETARGTGTGANAATASGLNWVGSSLLIAFAAYYSAAALVALDIADTSSNVWTALTARTNTGDTNIKGQFFYVISPATSASQNVTVTKSGAFIGLSVVGLQGFTPTFGSQTAGTSYATGASSVQAPAIGSNGDLVLAGKNHDNLEGSLAIDAAFSAIINAPYVAGVNEESALAWKEVTGSVQPTWSWSLTQSAGAAQNISFTSGAAASGFLLVEN